LGEKECSTNQIGQAAKTAGKKYIKNQERNISGSAVIDAGGHFGIVIDTRECGKYPITTLYANNAEKCFKHMKVPVENIVLQNATDKHAMVNKKVKDMD